MARHTVRELIKTGEFIIAPGVFDMISAKIADASPAKLLYLTGYGTVRFSPRPARRRDCDL